MSSKDCKPPDGCRSQIQAYAQIQQNNAKSEVTHTDFMNFVGRFYESVTYPLYLELTAARADRGSMLGKEHYRRFKRALKTRLCSCYIFDESAPLEDVQFETELQPLDHIDSITEVIDKDIAFLARHSVLGGFESASAAEDSRRIRRQAAVNSRRRQKIAAVLADRLRISGYFHAYEALHKDLENMYKKIRVRRRRKQTSSENEFIEEHLHRNDEFFEKFGGPDQFGDDAFVFGDVLADDPLESTEDAEFTYLS